MSCLAIPIEFPDATYTDITSKELVFSEPDAEKAMTCRLNDPELFSRDGIQKFADEISNLPDSLGEDPFPLYHSFSDGLYAREIHIPKGYACVGKLHKHESMVYMLKGKVLVADETGYKEVCAPSSFVSKPGVKRVGYVVEDVVWIDIHSVKSSTVEEAEKEIFAESYEELDDYAKTVKSLGYSEDEVLELSNITSDITALPEEHKDNIEIKSSDIDGLGVFAFIDFSIGGVVGAGRIKDSRTPIGRYTNHSDTPNSDFTINEESIIFVANQHIKTGEEITVDYREARKIAEELDSMLNKSNVGWLACQE